MTSPENEPGNENDLDPQGQPPGGEDREGLSGSTSHEDDDTEQAAAGGEDESTDDVEEPDTSNQPNIKFVGREEVTIIVEGERQTEMKPRVPPTHIQNGMEKINLPSRETQLAGAFYHKKADTIVNLFPTLYKHVK